ncbi:glycosyltransferase, partial [Salmonella enterica subsp. enterica serovar Kentucky]|nr:glycosyltransferase [Salmonella enterica subsp. enterica serovar Kentucky]
IIQHGLSERVKFFGFVSEKDLPSLYKGSLGLVFPSLYEGFGLLKNLHHKAEKKSVEIRQTLVQETLI